MSESFDDLQKKMSCNGTERYMAPEMSNEGRHGIPADIWAFGMMVIRMATGQLPYPRLSAMAARIKIAQIGNIQFTTNNSSLKLFVEHCLKLYPNERLTASQLLEQDFIRS